MTPYTISVEYDEGGKCNCFQGTHLNHATHPSTIRTERLLFNIFFSLELIRKSKSAIVKMFES